MLALRSRAGWLIAVRAMDATDAEAHVQDLFGPDFLVERPLLAAIRAGSGAVLLVDELDRADDEFEAFLLEVLSEFAVTIPEIGRIAAETPPAVICGFVGIHIAPPDIAELPP